MTNQIISLLRRAMNLESKDGGINFDESSWSSLNQSLQFLEDNRGTLKTNLLELGDPPKKVAVLPSLWQIVQIHNKAVELLPKLRPQMVPLMFALIEIMLELGAEQIVIDETPSASLSDEEYARVVAVDHLLLLGLYPGVLSLSAKRARTLHKDGRWKGLGYEGF